MYAPYPSHTTADKNEHFQVLVFERFEHWQLVTNEKLKKNIGAETLIERTVPQSPPLSPYRPACDRRVETLNNRRGEPENSERSRESFFPAEDCGGQKFLLRRSDGRPYNCEILVPTRVRRSGLSQNRQTFATSCYVQREFQLERGAKRLTFFPINDATAALELRGPGVSTLSFFLFFTNNSAYPFKLTNPCAGET